MTPEPTSSKGEAPKVLAPEGPLALGSAYGIELEYMIVDRKTLAVRPIADQLLSVVSGGEPVDFEEGIVAWSNELVLHVIELKTNGPTPSLAGWASAFQAAVTRINAELEPMGAMLLPGAMHPFMDPAHETVLWPHDYGEVYRTYHRIFHCFRHGWANLQSTHINLPFANDAEFERLHAAIRALLPLMPAIAASSPVVEGVVTGVLDRRLDVYCTHQSRIPEAMGLVIPDTYLDQAEYDEKIFVPLRKAAAALDPDGLLVPEFLNARGSIARFQRGAIEIRVLDIQESPRMDLGVALLVTSVVQALAEERWAPIEILHALETEDLRKTFDACIASGGEAMIEDSVLLTALGRGGPMTAADVWRELLEEVRGKSAAWKELGPSIEVILDHGPLARRLLAALGEAPDHERIELVWRRLSGCLADGEAFLPAPAIPAGGPSGRGDG
ncbi:Carboxylate-amine ligase YbdK [Planctomycetes bacterium Poly30]|uniref:Carboxylate-amine ligase YbdK n=1 Tax=Saltatorellus ferox TaxID=2528018 RepID=A0A518EWU4_9BACT|nr:Carboxylate-amine ligase YbdK [Planctomycetes bacterium Poly30]